MKSTIAAFVLLVGLCCFAHAQAFSFGLSYDYLSSPQLDNSVRTYNLSRPFVDEKQPFLTSGLGLEGGYLLPSDQSIRFGIKTGYANHRSKRTGTGSTIQLSLNTIDLGLLLHFEKPSLKGGYLDASVSGIVGILSKRVDQEPYLVDGSRLRSYQVGGLLGLSAGYKLRLNERIQLSPFAGMKFAPYFSDGKSEALINQTSTLVEGETFFWKWQLGIRLHLN